EVSRMASTAFRIVPLEGSPTVAHPDKRATMIHLEMLFEVLWSFFFKRFIASEIRLLANL
ncbi:MAG: hypothetical protein VYD37_05685, partial [Gemmatimonadota bacterium]|nr:hypothetical protein [Gemmatimonadota bacterium]